MGRPTKQGLDYFPLDTACDVKLTSFIGKYGATGFGVYIGLLQCIYAEGYYLKVDEDFVEDFSIRFGIEEDYFIEVLSYLIKRKFFNPEFYESDFVITSKGIQERFIEATKRRKMFTLTKFMLTETQLMHTKTQPSKVNADKSTQSKVKESKVNKKISKDIKKNTKNKKHKNDLLFNYETGFFEETIPSEWYEVWQARFPDVEISREIIGVRDWLKETGNLKKDHKAFITNWLKRVQEKKDRISSGQSKSNLHLSGKAVNFYGEERK